MGEERIQEIKDSINFQYELIVSKGIDKSALLFTDEEQELLEEVERLHNIIKEVREYIEMHTPSDIGICGNKTKRYYTLGEDSVDHILEILDKGERNRK